MCASSKATRRSSACRRGFNGLAKLIGAAKSHHMKLFIQIAIATAARSGAILDLTWSQIDFDRKLIDFGRGWGNKRRAVVPMNDDLLESLKIARDLAQTDYVIEYKSMQIASVKSGFRRLCKDCGIEASPHVLRHTAATWLVMDGVPLAEVARLLGDSERTVEKVYGKHAPDYLRRAVNSLNLIRPKTNLLQL
ncbi:MAG: site-specific integrase [Alphaproteobacteria bacterium]|nr:site-specific integrase [Alphaproteobacteria bacterium]